LPAPRAGAVGEGALRCGGGLPGEAEVEHALGEDLSDFQGEVFDVRELGPPGGAIGPVELEDEVFGDPFEVGA
jgi:hypothetical protein